MDYRHATFALALATFGIYAHQHFGDHSYVDIMLGVVLSAAGIIAARPYLGAIKSWAMDFICTGSKVQSTGPWPDFDKWDTKEVFSLAEVAALWLNREPAPLPLTPQSLIVFQQMHNDIHARVLKTRLSLDEAFSLATHQVGNYPKDDEDPIHVNSHIGRTELRRYALARGERPAFLFKDARAA